MAEATQESPEEQAKESAATPSLTAEQVSEIVREAIDARVPNIMSGYDKKLNAVQADLRKATMSDAEQEAEDEQAESDELAQLRRENAILTAGADMPAAVKAFKELNSKDTGKEQLDFLQTLIDAAVSGDKSPDEGSDAEGEGDDTASVDPNRRQNVPPDMTDEAADAILDQFETWPSADFWRS